MQKKICYNIMTRGLVDESGIFRSRPVGVVDREGNVFHLGTLPQYIPDLIMELIDWTRDNKLEKLSPHLLRHTFCTNMANAGMNPKALQYIMGHASINMTLNYYAHPTLDSAKAEMERISA